MLWQLSDNFQPIFYDQLKNYSWIYCMQASAEWSWKLDDCYLQIAENGGESGQHYN